MPVRKIPKNYLFVTGGYSSRKNEQMDAFESLLEKDYLLLLDFDDTVEKFETQPVRVPVPGVPNGYVPDVLIFYLPDADTGIIRRPSLVDVKHSDEVKRNEKKYAPKFAAATRFAESKGWEFAVVDQTQIRTSRLAFLKFLREYRNINPSEDDIQRVLECVGIFRDFTVIGRLKKSGKCGGRLGEKGRRNHGIAMRQFGPRTSLLFPSPSVQVHVREGSALACTSVRLAFPIAS